MNKNTISRERSRQKKSTETVEAVLGPETKKNAAAAGRWLIIIE